MSTPSQRSTRDSILDAAAHLFSERGGAVRLEDVADEAGVSRQAVYLHFGSRSGLLIAIAQHIDGAGVLPSLLTRVVDAPTALDALDAVANLHAEYHPMIHQVARIFMEGRYTDEALRAAWDERMEGRRSLYRAVVERLHLEARLDLTWDVEPAVDILFVLTSWQTWEQLVIDQSWSKEEYRDRLSALLRRTLVTQPSPIA